MDPTKIVVPKPESFISFATFTFPLAMFILLPFAFQTTKQTGDIWNVYTMSILVLFPMAAVAAVLYNNQVFLPAFSNFTIFTVGFMLMAFFIIIIYNTVISYAKQIKSVLYLVLLTISILLGFALLFAVLAYFFTDKAMQEFFRVFLLLPAVIYDTFSQFIEQFPTAPPAFAILFVIEIILIILVILIPLLISQNPPFYSTLQFNGVHLLQKDPLNLSNKKELVLANSYMLSIADDPTAANNPYQKQFSLSMWIYMNPSEAAQNPNEVTLLYYGTKELSNGSSDTTPTPTNQPTTQPQAQQTWQVTNPKPRITYLYDPHLGRDMYNIYLQEDEPNIPTYRVHIPNQKWNQFVFVYQTDHVDLFINGHLEKSFPQSIGITQTYKSSDQITIGDVQHASYGAIGNIIYYDYPMTLNQVTDSWNKQKSWVDGTLYVPYARNNSNPK